MEVGGYGGGEEDTIFFFQFSVHFLFVEHFYSFVFFFFFFEQKNIQGKKTSGALTLGLTTFALSVENKKKTRKKMKCSVSLLWNVTRDRKMLSAYDDV